MSYTITPAPGTISIGAGGTTITGVGTTFTAYLKGYLINVPGFGIGQLASDPTNDLSATLVQAISSSAITTKAFSAYPQPNSSVYSDRVRTLIETLDVTKPGVPLTMDSTLTVGDPGAGKVRFNSATNPTIACISYTDNLGNSCKGRVQALDDSVATVRSVLEFLPTDSANAYLDLDVTGAITDGTTYAQVPVIMRAGTVPSNGAALGMVGIASGVGLVAGGSAGQSLVKNSGADYDASWAARREVLTAGRTYYVRADGSDSNTGLANSSGGAFLTIAKATAAVGALDASIYPVTISIGAGTWNEVAALPDVIGSSTFTLVGSGVGSTFIRNINLSPYSAWSIGGFGLNGSGQTHVAVGSFATCTMNAAINFGATTSQHMNVGTKGVLSVIADYSISGGAAEHIIAQGMGFVTMYGRTVTLTGTPAFSIYAYANNSSALNMGAMTFVGSATGSRYYAATGAFISVGGGGANYFPGNSAGSVGNGTYA